MSAIEFSGKIKKGQILVPKKYSSFDNATVRVILQNEEFENSSSSKINFYATLNKMKRVKMFSSIENPVLFQKQLRDEWE